MFLETFLKHPLFYNILYFPRLIIIYQSLFFLQTKSLPLEKRNETLTKPFPPRVVKLYRWKRKGEGEKERGRGKKERYKRKETAVSRGEMQDLSKTTLEIPNRRRWFGAKRSFHRGAAIQQNRQIADCHHALLFPVLAVLSGPRSLFIREPPPSAICPSSTIIHVIISV